MNAINSKKIVVLASGGLDSAILIHELTKQFDEVYPLYFESGYIWEKTEFYWFQKFLSRLKNKKIKPLKRLSDSIGKFYEHHWSITGKKVPGFKTRDEAVYLPGKNILLIAHGAVYCTLQKISNLALGPLKTNPFPDATPAFFKHMAKTCSEALNFPIKVHVPFLKRNKKEVMQLGRNLPLHLTFSCLRPKKLKHCGRCNKCAERKKAFLKTGRADLTSYAA